MSISTNLDKYVKHNYEDIKEIIETLKDPMKITRSYLCELFSNSGTKQNPDGSIVVTQAQYKCTDYFDLPAGILKNQSKPIKDTTFGIFIFNSLVLSNSFGDKINYLNEPLGGAFSILESVISDGLMNGTLTVSEFGTFCDTVIWLGYFTELFMPGVSMGLIVPNKNVTDMKKKLLKENPKFLTNEPVDNATVSEYIEKIQKPLLNKAKEELKNDPGKRLYELKKPTFGNNYKNMMIGNGPMIDLSSGKYRINNNSFCDGITPENFDLLANKALYASYSRSVNTAIGGMFAKYTAVMMQTVVLGEKDSDCGTKTHLNYKVTETNMNGIKYNYMLENGKLVLITPENIKNLIGKTIKMRSPLFCKNKTHICNKCAGETFFKMGLKNIGLTSSIPMNASLNKSMKKMHDLSVKTTPVNLSDYTQWVK